MERVKEMSLEFTSRNRQQEFISKITAEYLTDFGTVDEAAMLYTQLARFEIVIPPWASPLFPDSKRFISVGSVSVVLSDT